jgi:peptide-O-fucosyltransferase
VPSIESTARQIARQMRLLRNNVNHLFLSTDADPREVEALKEQLNINQTIEVKQFVGEEWPSLSDAAVSIVDQWICAHAQHFVGTHLSTFSFRIHEDREILGFPPESTFNRLCSDEEESEKEEKKKDGKDICEQPAKWTIVYE